MYVPSAAAALGKGLSGSSRLAKELGFSFKDAKDPAKNFDQHLFRAGFAVQSSEFNEVQSNFAARIQGVVEIEQTVQQQTRHHADGGQLPQKPGKACPCE